MKLITTIVALSMLVSWSTSSESGAVVSTIGDKDGFGIGVQADESFSGRALPGYDGPGDADGTDKWFYNEQSFTFNFELPVFPVYAARLEVFTGGQGYNPFDINAGAPTSVFLNNTFIGYLTIGDISGLGVGNNFARKDTFDLMPYLGLLTGSDTFRFRPYATGSAFGDGWVMDYLELTLIPEPGTLLQQLHDDVTGPPPIGPGKSLGNKIALAQVYYAVPDVPATCAVLTDFLNEVRAQRGKKLTLELADQLTADANTLMVAILCP